MAVEVTVSVLVGNVNISVAVSVTDGSVMLDVCTELPVTVPVSVELLLPVIV